MFTFYLFFSLFVIFPLIFYIIYIYTFIYDFFICNVLYIMCFNIDYSRTLPIMHNMIIDVTSTLKLTVFS